MCFQDTLWLASAPTWPSCSKNGGIWKDYKGLSYTNPYNHEVWEYLVQVAEDAARHGFREIQFDYVRFPSDGKISEAVYPGAELEQRGRHRRRSWPTPGPAGEAGRVGVGRRLRHHGESERRQGFGVSDRMSRRSARNVDIVCPMIYPSHYNAGLLQHRQSQRESLRDSSPTP